MGGVHLAVDGPVAHDGPAGGLADLHVEAVFLIKAHGLGHDDGGGAGDGDEADGEVGFLDGAGFHGLGGEGFEHVHGDHGADEGGGGALADAAEEFAAGGVVREDGADDGVFDAGGEQVLGAAHEVAGDARGAVGAGGVGAVGAAAGFEAAEGGGLVLLKIDQRGGGGGVGGDALAAGVVGQGDRGIEGGGEAADAHGVVGWVGGKRLKG